MPDPTTSSRSSKPTNPAAKQVFRTTIHGSIEDVWQEITRTDRPIPCFFNMRMHIQGLRPGSPFRMRSPDGRYTGIVGDILECDPPRRFAHTFRFTQFDDPPCRVIYDLNEVGDHVEFPLTLEDLPLGTKTAKQMAQGSQLIVDTLKATIEGTKPPFMMRFIHFMSKWMQPLTPKRCLTSKWP